MYTRGQLARSLGLGSETLRYYEKLKLLPAPARSANGYRIYNETHRKRLQAILHAKALGFSLSEIRELLTLPASDCAQVQAITQAHLASINQQLEQLAEAKARLEQLHYQCQHKQQSDCPLLDQLLDLVPNSKG